MKTAIMMLGALALPFGAHAADEDGARLTTQGNGRGAAPCVACHGADGGGQAAAGFPRLAGLNAAYLRKQLEDFASGVRANPTMQPMAAALNTEERAALADYYSRLPVPATPAATASPEVALRDAGSRLARDGRWNIHLPGCDQCHAPGGVGVGDHFPPLAGQSALYIANQLRAWKQGSRHNDPLQLMQSVAGKLDDADIAAVSAWYAGQPAAPAAREVTP